MNVGGNALSLEIINQFFSVLNSEAIDMENVGAVGA